MSCRRAISSQRFEAVWSAEALATHRKASDALYRIKDRAFAMVRERLGAGAPLTEYDVQQAMLGWFDEEGLIADDTPNVSAQENAGNPHYHPSPRRPPRHSSRRSAAARPLG